jgi:hypothetical protein
MAETRTTTASRPAPHHVRDDVAYLKCADGYGWAKILADFGDGAAVLFEGSGADITLLDLGSLSSRAGALLQASRMWVAKRPR